jgi:hypothetical protein
VLRLLATLLASSLVVAVVLLAAPRPAPLRVSARPVPLDPEDPARQAVGLLRYRGGLWLQARDDRFGGLSGIRMSPDGRRLVAISDCGRAFDAHLVYDERGNLADLLEPRLRPLRAPTGGNVLSDGEDAESLATTPDGGWIVGFEGRHRLWRYAPGEPPLAGVPSPLLIPPGLEKQEPNRGLETLVSLEDGRLFGVAEGSSSPAPATIAWLERDAAWTTLSYPLFYDPALPDEPFRPTDAALLPGGDVLVVERRFPPIAVRLRRLDRRTLEAGGDLTGTEVARLDPPLSIDNFEGIDVRTEPDGRTVVYLLSDDNNCRKGLVFRPSRQRTLLLAFALDSGPGQP